MISDRCEICHCSNRVETHHIRFQREATQDGIIDRSFHKNAQFNLLPLCEKCHNDVHQNKIQIDGWKQTSNGKILRHIKSEVNKHYDIELIMSIRKINTLHKTLQILREDYQIQISEYMLKKIVKEYI